MGPFRQILTETARRAVESGGERRQRAMKFPERLTVSPVAGPDLNPVTRLREGPGRWRYPGGGTAQ